MAKQVWTFTLDDGSHVVELDHRLWSGVREIKVDGKLAEKSRKFWWDRGTEHRFDISGATCVLRIIAQTFGFRYELLVDGKLV